MRLILLIGVVGLLVGCASVDQSVKSKLEEKTTWYPDGRVEVVKTTDDTTSNQNLVTGSAKQVVEKTRLSNATKSQSIGTSGVAQESASPLKEGTDFLMQLNQLGDKLQGR